ncbi:hypothetical protein JW911_00420 [Candidatus Peregrinibacteria bacterium]|nr:hypothetical protein [Candidatus Peregrinibacteria bacterium]
MKKFLALVALVAMVAVASVAQAATVTVQGTLGESVTVNDCTSGNDWTISVGSQSNDTCVATYTTNYAPGFALSFAATSENFEHQVIEEALEKIATPNATCTAQAGECFSYTFAVAAATGTYGTGLNGTVDTNQDDVPTSSFAVFTSADNEIVVPAENYTFTFYAWAEATSPAGAYALEGGSLTIASK